MNKAAKTISCLKISSFYAERSKINIIFQK